MNTIDVDPEQPAGRYKQLEAELTQLLQGLVSHPRWGGLVRMDASTPADLPPDLVKIRHSQALVSLFRSER